MKYYCSYPPAGEANPFFTLLENHLISEGWKSATFNLKTRNLFKNSKNVQVLWFHWPSSHWRNSNVFLKFLKITRFFYHITLASTLGYKLVWSAHNVLPHGLNDSTLELRLRKLFVRRMNLTIGHAKNTYSMLKEQAVIPKNYALAVHGHYEDFYKNKSNHINKGTLGFSESDIILLLKSGGKNYEDALKFFNFFSKQNFQNIKLLVIGKKIREKSNVTYIEGFISKEELASCMSICNYMVLPYEKITTSGAFFLALTFQKPVIARKLSFFEYHTQTNTAVLYKDLAQLEHKLKEIDQGKRLIDEVILANMKLEYNWKTSAKVISKELNKLFRE